MCSKNASVQSSQQFERASRAWDGWVGGCAEGATKKVMRDEK